MSKIFSNAGAEFVTNMLNENPEPEERWLNFDPPFPRSTVAAFERRGWIKTRGKGYMTEHRWTKKGRAGLRDWACQGPLPGTPEHAAALPSSPDQEARAMGEQADIHNRLAGKIVASIVKPPLDAGGNSTDVLILLESVVLGVVLALTRIGGDEIVLDTLLDGVRARAAEIRLGPLDPEGNA